MNQTKLDLTKILQPKKISEIIGQNHIVGEERLINQMIKNQILFSLIFFGPPGIGKSSIARVICLELKVDYYVFNCAFDNKKKLVEFLNLIKLKNQKAVLIIEEIHRLNIDKQDIFLSEIENENLVIFATTTENPFFVINPAIRSRSQLVELKPISDEAISAYIQKLQSQKLLLTQLTPNQITTLSQHVNGDLRFLINVINKFNLLYKSYITDLDFKVILGATNFDLTYDNDEWHNLKSALQKSIRGSDPDAAIYYLARLLESGDLKTIARRLIICAFEDIGLANMNLCNRVIHAFETSLKIGFPECYNILGPIVIEMALSPKSNSGQKALGAAIEYVRKNPNIPIPKHLQDNHYASAHKLGVKGYLLPHDYEYNYVEQQYLPQKLLGHKFYLANEFNPQETNWQKYWQALKKLTKSSSNN